MATLLVAVNIVLIVQLFLGIFVKGSLIQVDWINLTAIRGNSDGYYGATNMFLLELPQMTTKAQLHLMVSRRSSGKCPSTDIHIVLQHGSLPLIEVKNKTFPPDFILDRTTPTHVTLELTEEDNNLDKYYDILQPLPGMWYGVAYRKAEANKKIEQQGLSGAECTFDMEVGLWTETVMNIEALSISEPVKIVVTPGSQRIFKFDIPETTWNYNVRMLSCTYADSDPNTSNSTTCKLLMGVGSSVLPHIFRICEDDCNFTVPSPTTTDKQYIVLQNYDSRDIVANILINTDECALIGNSWIDLTCGYLGKMNRLQSNSDVFTVIYSLYMHPSSYEVANTLRLNDTLVLLTKFDIRQAKDVGSTLLMKVFIPNTERPGRQGESVLVCLQKGAVPIFDNKVDCADPRMVNTTSSSVTLYIPYPEAGEWFLALEARCYTWDGQGMIVEPCEKPVTTGFLLQTSPCVEGGCGDHGDCLYLNSETVLFSACHCNSGWEGYGCTDDTNAKSDSLQIASVLLLTISNGLFIPAIVVAVIRKHYMEAIVYFYTMFFSTFYHACDSSGTYKFCLLKYGVLSFCDFFGSLLSFWVTLVAMTRPPQIIYAMLGMVGALGIAVLVENDRHGLWTFVVPFLVGAAMMFSSWIVRCKTRKQCYPSKRKWLLFLLPGAGLAAVGLVLYAFVETTDNYFYIHSIWHVTMALCIVFLLPPKKSAEDKSSLGCCDDRELREPFAYDDEPDDHFTSSAPQEHNEPIMSTVSEDCNAPVRSNAREELNQPSTTTAARDNEYSTPIVPKENNEPIMSTAHSREDNVNSDATEEYATH